MIKGVCGSIIILRIINRVDQALSVEFDHNLDTYEVIPYALGGIDHAPTICVFPLIFIPMKKCSP